MHCVILAAGYGTRLQKDLTDEHKNLEGLPKALLPLKGGCLLDRLLRWLPQDIGKVVLVTNDIYHDQFVKHLDGTGITIINDGTRTPEERLGAIGDLILGLDGLPEDDTMVLASDLLIPVPFEELHDLFESARASVILTYHEPTETIHRKGVVEMEEDGRVVGFEEKPEKPKSRHAVCTVWLMERDVIAHVRDYQEQNPEKLDRPGDAMEYLVHQTPWYAFKQEERVLDVAGLDTYEELKNALN
ncbi:MAG: sugar phosphate nucleotidyltransferase [Candidatus Woesearchaeota archaeon]|jgi:NDP-sugar pyrophosphorylase family protein|nr:sugar phosphate nucleotidyltransferase [Candidatus Woesearchaeota archaeon]MDP7181020.1 sugar phosphate nucleotidyltransferase [Candidatus Woesearchaeota archaeon]MDP7198359.1 sugar phosphate nucleotidyltransferase [Candidatus Woesearchaeota archaeon]MDP7467461.1 sugar phosphate nucleotidyltransferase [Candidatus Woesearchaeota archaeon]MDP7647688.1 sugar phosphate nucleotidyltransferase [Candidatus Woesearchaeota archaeon]